MSEWWFSSNGKKVGPKSLAEINNLYRQRKIGPDTLVWKQGMEAWAPLSHQEQFESLRQSEPPPAPNPPPLQLFDYPLTKAWPRFFARLLDTWLETLILSFVAGIILGAMSTGFNRWISIPGSDALLAIILFPGAMVFDAVIYAVCGNTLGKALLGIRVVSHTQEKLTFSQYLTRGFRLWFSGMGLGIPLVNLLTWAMQYRKVRAGQPATYDENKDISVRTVNPHWLKLIIFILCFLSVMVVQSALREMDRADQRAQANREFMSMHDVWVNTATQRSAYIRNKWVAKDVQSFDKPVFQFDSTVFSSVAVLAMSEGEGLDPQEYADEYRRMNKSVMTLPTGQFRTTPKGINVWTASGSLKTAPGSRLEIEVRQIGNKFMRLSTIELSPTEHSRQSVEELKKALWSTVE
ncbi:RDD family protein [Pseudomonas japonica]|uniref:RDD family protein n=1 Tax=Pseudomonas japonica TaxID=256466 RepID=UPI0015E2E76E|nr:RDD family protein [Pseudomonas japonica]MBA1245814.1 RDD family protein [Pseudomonas japonica]